MSSESFFFYSTPPRIDWNVFLQDKPILAVKNAQLTYRPQEGSASESKYPIQCLPKFSNYYHAAWHHHQPPTQPKNISTKNSKTASPIICLDSNKNVFQICSNRFKSCQEIAKVEVIKPQEMKRFALPIVQKGQFFQEIRPLKRYHVPFSIFHVDWTLYCNYPKIMALKMICVSCVLVARKSTTERETLKLPLLLLPKGQFSQWCKFGNDKTSQHSMKKIQRGEIQSFENALWKYELWKTAGHIFDGSLCLILILRYYYSGWAAWAEKKKMRTKRTVFYSLFLLLWRFKLCQM